LVEVICDTSFLIHLATKKIKNINSLERDFGTIQFVVPQVVKVELEHLKNQQSKTRIAQATLNFIKNFKIIPVSGKFADEVIFNHIKKEGGIVGTLDQKLKQKVKDIGGSIVSLANDRIVLES
jgi:hypothetical protein